MHVKRYEDAKPYDAPNHQGVVGLRLQGFEPGGPTNQWIGYSLFLPGGGAGPDSTPFEKVYVVLDGPLLSCEWWVGQELRREKFVPEVLELADEMAARPRQAQTHAIR